MRTETFALENRIPIDVRTVPWIMLDEVMSLGADFEKLRSERKAIAKTRLTKRKAEPLRIIDPWWNPLSFSLNDSNAELF